ncbi:E3 ubiquitin-protein ligase UPL5 [Zea mays]|uniref:HECT-type E3 ubiquitin transferase n=1 Tax=Zea mays TaxID=4577 RepID=A0A3L6E0A8_MAIZE|nr:E3 ubiquitin-protein ligase UPL5 [Zea mays]
MHAGWDDTIGAVLDHLGACGYGRDLRLLYAGRQLALDSTLAELRLPPDSTLHLLARLRSTQHPHAWQLASHIASTAAIAESEPSRMPSAAFSLDELVKEFILRAHRANLRLSRYDRAATVEDRATADHTAEYLEIFLQAGAALALAEQAELHGALFMEFKNEEATASAVDPLHLKYFTFAGRIIGLALMHKVQVGVVLDRTLFLHLAGRSITLEDISVADPVKYASCKKILEMDAAEIDNLYLTFSRGAHELGTEKIIDLCPGGEDVSVNIGNRKHYIDLLIKNIFVDSISSQLTHFAEGFADILVNPKRREELFECLDLEDFDRLLGGSNNAINLQDWKSHTQYNGYKEKDRQITLFWKAVERMSIERQRQLLFFWTSVKYLPSDGFCGLSSKLYIYKTSDSPDRLPSSQTCFYRLCLPPYTSMKMMENQLQKITQEHVSCSFGAW